MNAYRFKKGETKPCESLIGISEQPEGFVVFGNGFEEIDWTQKEYVDGKLADIPVPEPPAPYVPTAKEIKQKKIRALTLEYDPQFAQLDSDAIAAKVLYDDMETFSAILAEKTTLTKEYMNKLEEIKNG